MELRKILLRVMLGSLALAAVVGVVAVLFFRDLIIGRLIGAALMTTAASGLMIALSFLADRKFGRRAALLGMSAIVLEFLLGLSLICGLSTILDSRWTDPVAVLMLTIGGEFLPGMVFLVLASLPRARFAGWTGTAVCAVVFLLFVVPPWIWAWIGYEDWSTSNRCNATGFSVALFGAMAALTLVGVGFDRRHWRFVGTVAAPVACAIAIIGIWRDTDHGAALIAAALVAAFGGLAVVIAHANLVLLCPLKPGQRWVRIATIVASALTAIGIVLTCCFDSDTGGEVLSRFAGAAGILAACGTLALLVLALLNRKPALTPVLSPITRYTLLCPGCNQTHVLTVGDTQCPNCLLGIHVRFHEPHCPNCNYLLYMLSADRCPECGTIVRTAKPSEASPSTPAIAIDPAAAPTAGG